MISFISIDSECVYVDKNLIIDKFAVLANLLNLENEFNDVPKKDSNGNYIFFKDIHTKSIICIFNFLATNFENEREKNEFLFFLKKLDNREIFIDAVNICEPLSLFIPSNLYEISHKPPMNKTEDLYNEYQFFELFMDFEPAGNKDIYHKILNNYLSDGWIIVEQIEKPNNKYTIILRKKI